MKKFFFLTLVMMLSPQVWGALLNEGDEGVVVLSGSNCLHHFAEAAPEAIFILSMSSLSISLDATHYTSYTVTLTSPAGDSVTVNATSPTVTIPVSGDGDGYVVTIDGGDYGTYDGVFSRSGASTVTLTDQQALRLVKNRRQSVPGVNYYAGVVPNIITDSLRCHITTPPTQSWATENSDKWLVFVDEQPTWGWSHKCSYYYFPKTVATSDSLQWLGYEGQMPPRNVSLTPVELSSVLSPADFKLLPQSIVNQLRTTPVCNPSNHEVKVVVIGSVATMEVHPLLTNYRNWNECAAIYTILTTKYGIPATDINLLIGNSDGTIADPESLYDVLPLPKDLDGDGIDENIIGFTEANLRAVFNNLAEERANHPIKNLMVFFAGDLLPRQDNYAVFQFEQIGTKPLDGYDFSQLLYRVGADNVSCVYSCNNSWMLSTNTLSARRVITASASTTYSDRSSFPHPLHEEYSGFGYYWLSALAGMDITSGDSINTDIDNNGFSSFNELHHYADSVYTAYFWSHPLDDITPWSSLMPYPSITSSPLNLKDSLSVTHVPPYANLMIKRSSDSTGALKWDSPDIWVRNQNDGVLNQESEHISLTNGQPVYVYLRVRCADVANLNDYGRYVNLFAIPSNEDVYNWSMLHDNPGALVGYTAVGEIAADTSAIYTFVWDWDQTPDPDSPEEELVDWQQQYAESGNMLPLQFVAFLGDQSDSWMLNQQQQIHDLNFVLPDNKYTYQKKVAIRPMSGKSFVVSNPPMPPSVRKGSEFTFPLETAGAGRYSIEILPDQAASSGTVLSNSFRTFLTLSTPLMSGMDSGSSVTAATQVSGATGKYRINNATAAFSGLNLQGHTAYTLTLACDVLSTASFANDVDWHYHIVLRDSTGAIVDGQSVRVYQEGSGNSGGGIMGAPRVQSVKGLSDNYQLTETAISDPAQYEWYDTAMDKVGEGKSVTVNRQQTGDVCVLKVTMADDGHEEYAVAQLDGAPGIQSVSPVPFDGTLTITLTAPAETGMALRVVAVSGTVTPIEVAIPVGASEVMLTTASLPSGQYVVGLTHNGEIVQSVNVVK